MRLLSTSHPQVAEVFRVILGFLKREMRHRCHVMFERTAKPAHDVIKQTLTYLKSGGCLKLIVVSVWLVTRE